MAKQATSTYGIRKMSGPFATVYACPACKFTLSFKNGQPGTGRGHGLRNGGKLFHQMCAHVRTEHPHLVEGKKS